MRIKTAVRKSALSLLITFLCVQPLMARQVLDKVIAVVNAGVISQYELDNYTKYVLASMESQGNAVIPPSDVLQDQVLHRMILDKIQLQMAEQTGIEVDSITVSEAIQYLARQQGKTAEQLRQSIEDKGINYDEFRNIIANDITIQRLQAREVARDVVIAKSDVESYLSSPAGQDRSGTEYRLSHILISAPEAPTPDALKVVQAKADGLVAKLQKGDDFAKAAMTQSSGRQALSGGDLGWRTTGELPTIFVSYIPAMQIGDVVGPIRSSGGFHIVKLTGKRTTREDKLVETHARQITIIPDNHTSSDEARKLLASIRKQIVNGSDFAKIAQKKSQDLRSAAKGGDIGWVNEQAVLPKFYEVMNQLRNNEISEPFQTEEGWHIVQVLDRRNQYTSNEAAYNRALEVLTMRKTNEAIESWTKRIRDEARIDIMLPNAASNKQA